MYQEQEDVFYYLTLTNQSYPMPPLPDGVDDGVLKGMYCYDGQVDADVNLFGSGAIMVEVLRAKELLEALEISCSVWSVTSYNELAREALAVERQLMMGVGSVEAPSYVQTLLAESSGIFVAASDYVKALPNMIAPWVPGPYTILGTDGFGLSESRECLRDYFEVSAEWIAFAALSTQAQHDRLSRDAALDFARAHGLDLDKTDPAVN
jgi:pyruvate dehydrogenase E1 component